MSPNRWLLSCLAVCWLLFTTDASGQEAGRVPKYSARAFYETTAYIGASFSADESRLLITSDATGVFNAFSQSVKGGMPDLLTQSKQDATFGRAYFPHDDRVLYVQNEGGNELDHVFVREKDGQARDLTPGKKVKALFAGWSGDLQHFYVASNERDPKFFDLYRYEAGNYARSLFFKNAGGFTTPMVSRDGAGWPW